MRKYLFSTKIRLAALLVGACLVSAESYSGSLAADGSTAQALALSLGVIRAISA